jgi:hypothetical protein
MLSEYLEIAEMKLVDQEQLRDGSLTTFSGFPFDEDRPYTYREGKRLLGLSIRELRKNQELVKKLGMAPTVPGRGAITGTGQTHVWDFLSIESAGSEGEFTKHPHLTLAIKAQGVEAMVTVPNAVNSVMKNRIKALGNGGFLKLTSNILDNLKPLLQKSRGAMPLYRGVQRRYPSQRSVPFIDAQLEFDLRTAVPSASGPKAQPLWLETGYASFVNREHTNYQIQFGVMFPYDRCPEVKEKDALDLMVSSWLACKPLIDLAN